MDTDAGFDVPPMKSSKPSHVGSLFLVTAGLLCPWGMVCPITGVDCPCLSRSAMLNEDEFEAGPELSKPKREEKASALADVGACPWDGAGLCGRCVELLFVGIERVKASKL